MKPIQVWALIIMSISLGNLFSEVIGWLVFGVGLLLMSIRLKNGKKKENSI